MKIVIVLGLATLLSADDTTTRGIVPEDVINARPAAKPGTTAYGKASPARKTVYTRVPSRLANDNVPGRHIGVTIWRLRSAKDADSGGARILVHGPDRTEEWIPERVPSTARLQAGDLVRLTVEVPESGYLYVIDREHYESGESGEPHLIFPTTKTRSGDNRVQSGKLIDIPGQADQPSFFQLTKSRRDQVHEELTVLVTPEPLHDVTIGPSATVLPTELVAKWEKTWVRMSTRSNSLVQQAMHGRSRNGMRPPTEPRDC